MTTPTNGYVPAKFLAFLDGSPRQAERNTAAAFNRLRAAHPEAHINAGLAAAYWERALDIAIHQGKVAGITDKGLSGIGLSPHGLGIRLNIGGVSPAVAAQFGFKEYNSYTFTYQGPYSWAVGPAKAGLDLDTVAHQVIGGLWGSGPARRTNLEASGYDYATVQTHVNALLGIAPAPVPVTPTPPAVADPSPTQLPAPDPKPTSPNPPAAPPAPTQEAPTVTADKPLTPAQIAADAAKLQADADALAGAPTALAGLLAANPTARKRLYAIYAGAALVLSFGPDIVSAGVLTQHTAPVFVAVIGLSTSVLLKIGVALGFVAASNVKN